MLSQVNTSLTSSDLAAALSAEQQATEPAPGHHSVYCPTCSSRLYSRRCKLICAQCGYYLSCADYY
jgi:hypothetical protein